MNLLSGRINDRPIISSRHVKTTVVESLSQPGQMIYLNSFTCSVGVSPGYGAFVLKCEDALYLSRKKYVNLYLGYTDSDSPEIPLWLPKLVPVGIHPLPEKLADGSSLCCLELCDVRYYWGKPKITKVYNWLFLCREYRGYASYSVRTNTSFTTTTSSVSTTSIIFPTTTCYPPVPKCVHWTWRTILIDLFCQLINSAGLITSTTTGSPSSSTTLPIFFTSSTTSVIDNPEICVVGLPIYKPQDSREYVISLPGGVSADWDSVPYRLGLNYVSPVEAIAECLKAYGNALFCFDPFKLKVSIKMNGEDDPDTQVVLEQYQDRLVYSSNDLLPLPSALPEIVRVHATHVRNPPDLIYHSYPIVGVDVNISKYADANGIFIDYRDYRDGTTAGVLSAYIIISGIMEVPYGWHNCEIIPPTVEYPCPTNFGMFARDGSPCQLESDFIFEQASCRPFLRMAYRVFDYLLRRWPSRQTYWGLLPVAPSGRVHTITWREDRIEGGFRTDLDFHPEDLDLFITRYELPPRDLCCCPSSTSTKPPIGTTTRDPCEEKYPCCYEVGSGVNCEVLYTDECRSLGGMSILAAERCDDSIVRAVCTTTQSPLGTTCYVPPPEGCCPGFPCPDEAFPGYGYGPCCIGILLTWNPPVFDGGVMKVPADIPNWINTIPHQYIDLPVDPNAFFNKIYGPVIGQTFVVYATGRPLLGWKLDRYPSGMFNVEVDKPALDFLPDEVIDYYTNYKNEPPPEIPYVLGWYSGRTVRVRYKFNYELCFSPTVGIYKDPSAGCAYYLVIKFSGAYAGVDLKLVDGDPSSLMAWAPYGTGRFFTFVHTQCWPQGVDWPETKVSIPCFPDYLSASEARCHYLRESLLSSYNMSLVGFSYFQVPKCYVPPAQCPIDLSQTEIQGPVPGSRYVEPSTLTLEAFPCSA